MSKINDIIQEKFFSTIPNEWKMKDINDFIEILSGFPFDSALFHDQEGNPLIRIRDLDFQEIETYYNGNFDLEYLMSGGEVLIGMDGDFNIVKWKSKPALLNQRIMRINSKNESTLNNTFLFYQLIGILKKINDITPQTTVKHLSINDIKNLILPIPKIDEQQKIASILENVDKNIDKTQEIIEKYEMMKQGLMYDLFIKGIDDNGKPHTEFKNSELGEIPKNWQIKTVKESTNKSCVGFVGTCDPFYVEENGIPMLRTTNIKNGKLDLTDLKYVTLDFHLSNKKSQLKPHDLIIARHGESGTSCLVPKGLNEANCLNIVIIRADQTQIKPEFMNYLFNSFIIKYQVNNKAGGSVQGVINTKEIEKFLLPIPVIEEQERILKILKGNDYKLYYEREYLNKLQKIKTGLMQDLLTGKVRVKT